MKLGLARTQYECGPLDLLLSIVGELVGERERRLSGYFDTSAHDVAVTASFIRLTIERFSASRWMPSTVVGVKASLRLAPLGV